MSDKTKMNDADENREIGAGDLERVDAPEVTGVKAMLNVPLKIEIVIGRTSLPLSQVTSLKKGDVIDLDRQIGDVVDVMVNGHLIGHGKLVHVDESGVGVKLSDIVKEIVPSKS